ncbi:hypothetical protein V6N13_078874 [Hibiscus sabdariffa]|uniref:Uncharacterized protein n=1 Tax=Hibiscus sabdariffa TaxID=183260 RepID=A0ABR2RQ59_9ROSI
MESSRVKGRCCNSTVATAVVLLLLMFAAQPATAKIHILCYFACVMKCERTMLLICANRCKKTCNYAAAVTDGYSRKVDVGQIER